MGMIPTTLLVMTTRRMEGNFKAELRMLIVPLMAGRIISLSTSSDYNYVSIFIFTQGFEVSTAAGSGLARCSIYVTPSRAESNAPSAVMSLTMAKSTDLAYGAINGCSLISLIELSLRIEMRAR